MYSDVHIGITLLLPAIANARLATATSFINSAVVFKNQQRLHHPRRIVSDSSGTVAAALVDTYYQPRRCHNQ